MLRITQVFQFPDQDGEDWERHRLGGIPAWFCLEYVNFEVSEVSSERRIRTGQRHGRHGDLPGKSLAGEQGPKRRCVRKASARPEGSDSQAEAERALILVKALLKRIPGAPPLVWEKSKNVSFLRKLGSLLKRTPGT